MDAIVYMAFCCCIYVQGYTFALTGHANHRLTSSGTTRARLLLETEENFNGLIYKTRLYSHVRSLFPRK